MFLKQMEVGQFAIFAYLFGSEAAGEALVIDPAAEGEMIVREAAKNGLKIKYIVNTHCHIDHVMGNKKMKDLTGAEIIIHAADAPYLAHQSAQLMGMFHAEASPPGYHRQGERPHHSGRTLS